MCDKAVNTYPSTIGFVLECYKTQCVIKQLINAFFVFVFPDQCKTQEMCDTVVFNFSPLLVYCPDKYIAQKMCNEAVDEDLFYGVSLRIQSECRKIRTTITPQTGTFHAVHITQKMLDQAVGYSLAVLKLTPDWFVTGKMIKKLFPALYSDKNIVYFDEGSGDAVFDCKGMGILNIDSNNISLDDKLDKDDPGTIILMRLLALHMKFRKRKELKKKS